MFRKCNNRVKYQVTHGWQNIRGEWIIALAGYGTIVMNSEEDYQQAQKQGYVEMEIEIVPRESN